jgi:hypothetical protein
MSTYRQHVKLASERVYKLCAIDTRYASYDMLARYLTRRLIASKLAQCNWAFTNIKPFSHFRQLPEIQDVHLDPGTEKVSISVRSPPNINTFCVGRHSLAGSEFTLPEPWALPDGRRLIAHGPSYPPITSPYKSVMKIGMFQPRHITTTGVTLHRLLNQADICLKY